MTGAAAGTQEESPPGTCRPLQGAGGRAPGLRPTRFLVAALREGISDFAK